MPTACISRLDERNVEAEGLTSDSAVRPWWLATGAADTSAQRFLQYVNAHIRNGSRGDSRRAASAPNLAYPQHAWGRLQLPATGQLLSVPVPFPLSP